LPRINGAISRSAPMWASCVGIGLADTDKTRVGVQAHPGPVRKEPLNSEIAAEADGLDLSDLHGANRGGGACSGQGYSGGGS
jgi:hypothetical protein